MNKINYKYIHTNFKLNGNNYDRVSLKNKSEVFIKDGEYYEKEIGLFIFEWLNDLSFILMTTSGTTGKPKQVKISKQAMVNSALATGTFFNLLPGNKALNCLPIKFIAGKMMFVRAIILGLEIDFVNPNSKPLSNNKTNYDFVAMVPLQVQNSLEELKNVNKLIIGGAKISEGLKKEVLELPIEVYETYGMTETITHIAVKKIGEVAFTILPGVTISYDEKKCLLINAPRISKKTIVTNDIVNIINDKQFLFIGRYDNMINSGGIKLIPEQIEEKLIGKINSSFFITSIPDEKLGEKVVLILEGEKMNIDKSIFDNLQKFERPKEVFFVSQFQETATGKIKRKETLKMI